MDVKPGNFLLSDGDPPRVMLTDFELSRDIRPDSGDVTRNLTKMDRLTEQYASPELRDATLRKQWAWSHDTWALGIILLEIVLGEPCYWDPTTRRITSSSNKTLRVPLQPVDVAAHHLRGAFWECAASLCCVLLSKPDVRITADEAAHHDFCLGHGLAREHNRGESTSSLDAEFVKINAAIHSACVRRPGGVQNLTLSASDESGAGLVGAVLDFFASHVKSGDDLAREISVTVNQRDGTFRKPPFSKVVSDCFEAIAALCTEDAHREEGQARQCWLTESRGESAMLPLQDSELSDRGRTHLNALGRVRRRKSPCRHNTWCRRCGMQTKPSCSQRMGICYVYESFFCLGWLSGLLLPRLARVIPIACSSIA